MRSVDALRENDLERSRLVIVNDQYINRKRLETENTIVVLMATQHPVARDLRTLASSLEICSELERIGDYAKGIANINIRSGGLSLPRILNDIYAMGEKSVDLLRRSMTTFAENDFQTARDIIQNDVLIDECYTDLYHKAVNSVLEDAGNFERANDVIWAAHNLERSGDRATNICERVIYMVTGRLLESLIMTGWPGLLPGRD